MRPVTRRSFVSLAAAVMPTALLADPTLGPHVAEAKALPEGYVMWHSPRLCGCRLAIDADWTQDSVTAGISFRHPIQYTVRDIQIAGVCAEHAAVLDQPVADDPYFGSPGYIRLTTQPALKPSPEQRFLAKMGQPVPQVRVLDPREASKAERLYIHHFRYTGGTHRPDTCECVQYWTGDRSQPDGPLSHLNHPLHSERCGKHAHITDATELAVTIRVEQGQPHVES